MKTWQKATHKDIEKLVQDGKVIILSLGTIEAHGAHLPLGTDAYIAKRFARDIAKKTNSVLGPNLLFGPCETLLSFAGTITIKEKTLFLLLKDILDSIFQHGFKKVLIVNGHGGNTIVLEKICAHYGKTTEGSKVFFKSWYDVKFARNLKKKDKTYRGDHADRLETEIMLAINRNLVSPNLAVDDLVKWPLGWEKLDDYSQLMKNAVDGFPTKALLEKSVKNYETILKEMIKELRFLK
ncbi:MAG: creatininase family protein [Patescibacteria group bacterium]